MKNEEPKLQGGIQEFIPLLNRGEVYVDKTKLIQQLVSQESSYFFLTRPRRFGKTLLLSTIEQILQGNKKLFENFAIGHHNSGYDWKSSHVIRLDMSGINEANAIIFENNLTRKINLLAKPYGIEQTWAGSAVSLFELIHHLYHNYQKYPLNINGESRTADTPYIAVLIDEYDTPLIDNMNDPDNLIAVKKVLSQFYSSLKSASAMIRSILVTGISSFSPYSPFSSLNNLTDITFEKKYSTLCGFTPNEILRNYTNPIFQAYDTLINQKFLSQNATITDMLNMIRDWYDGYTWDGESKVLNPLSVITFLRNKTFERYWYKTGGPGFLKRLQVSDEDYFRVFSRNLFYKTTATLHQLSQLSATSALVATGYLTLESKMMGESGSQISKYVIAIPNTEVRMSFAEDYLIEREFPTFTSEAQKEFVEVSSDFSNAFCNRDVAEATRLLMIIFAKVSHQNFEETEAFHKSHMEKALLFSRGQIIPEDSKSKGDADFVLKMRGQVLVIEVKYHKLSSDDHNFIQANSSELEPVQGIYAQRDHTTIPPESVTCSEKNLDLRKTKKLELKQKIQRLLNKGIKLAFEQIDNRNYAMPYLAGNADVWAVAVSIVGRGEVAISYRQVGHKSA
jgi:hypothetical protein